jgi:triacylglycerol lipase
MRLIRVVPIFLALLLLQPAFAETVLLVPGYLDRGGEWRASGVAAALAGAGWQDGGHLLPAPGGAVAPGPAPTAPRRFYTLALPTDAPLLLQARELARYVDLVRQRHPDESLVLVGHSAGGVVARLYAVENPQTRLAAVVTVASPHLGTELAEAGLMVGQSPLGWITPLIGAGAINSSQGLYYYLLPEQPGSLLFWLNRQPHPVARYVAIVRGNDGVVPPLSQDLNNVMALRGRAETLAIPGNHALHPADGPLLATVLARLFSS